MGRFTIIYHEISLTALPNGFSQKEFPVSSSHWPQSNEPEPSESAPSEPVPTKQELKAAMKAFRKRLKLTCLDDQSKIGVGPMSSGQQSSIVGITPPNQYPQSVWEELARRGRIKYSGNGQYELGEP